MPNSPFTTKTVIEIAGSSLTKLVKEIPLVAQHQPRFNIYDNDQVPYSSESVTYHLDIELYGTDEECQQFCGLPRLEWSEKCLTDALTNPSRAEFSVLQAALMWLDARGKLPKGANKHGITVKVGW